MSENKGKIKVTLIKSVIGTIEQHRACVRGLGLRRLHHSVLILDTPENRGRINRVNYLVKAESI
jgi:large subunit ribosomal protein L30